MADQIENADAFAGDRRIRQFLVDDDHVETPGGGRIGHAARAFGASDGAVMFQVERHGNSFIGRVRSEASRIRVPKRELVNEADSKAESAKLGSGYLGWLEGQGVGSVL